MFPNVRTAHEAAGGPFLPALSRVMPTWRAAAGDGAGFREAQENPRAVPASSRRCENAAAQAQKRERGGGDARLHLSVRSRRIPILQIGLESRRNVSVLSSCV